MNNSKILYLFTRTPLHVGAGSSVGAIDQPIIRERHTGFPVIPGTSLKGVLRDTATRDGLAQSDVDAIFGEGFGSGSGEFQRRPRLVRRSQAAGVSCAVGKGELRFHNLRAGAGPFPAGARRTGFADSSTRTRGYEMPGRRYRHGFAEWTDGRCSGGYRFNRAASEAGKFPIEWETALLKLLDDPVWQAGKGRFVLLSNGDFAHFVKNACEVSQHVKIDPKTGTAEGKFLFNLEAVPAETLFFAPLTSLARANGELGKMADLFVRKPLLQFGGDGTTGLGFCTVKLS